MAWAKNGTPDTLSGTADAITISDLEAKIFNQFLCHTLSTGGNTNVRTRYNNNSNSVYAYRRSNDGGSDGTGTSQTIFTAEVDDADEPRFFIQYVASISGEEKLIIQHSLESASGASVAPQRSEIVAKFVPSPDADITRIDVLNQTSGDFNTNSNLSALGTD